MKYPAHIKIKAGKDAKDFAVLTQGSLEYAGGTAYVEYNTDGKNYILGISPDIVSINQSDSTGLAYTMIFENGKPSSFDINYNGLKVVLSLTDISFFANVGDDAAEMELSYTLSYGKEKLPKSKIYLVCNKIL